MTADAILPYAEAHWERSKALPSVDEALVARHLERWPELLGQPWELMPGGLRSLNIRIGDHVLRLVCDDGAGLQVEAALMRRVAPDVRVPSVVGCSDGALLLEYVELAQLPATAVAGRCVGRSAARLQEHRFGAAGNFDEHLSVNEPFVSAYDGVRGWAEGLLDRGVGERLGPDAEALRRAWDHNEPSMRHLANQPVLVHSDFKPANVKWVPSEQDVVVLDWEFAWAGPRLFDLGMMLRWGAPDPFVRGLEQGYTEAGGELPPGWRRQAELFDSFNLVGLLQGSPKDSRREHDVMGRLKQTLSGRG